MKRGVVEAHIGTLGNKGSNQEGVGRREETLTSTAAPPHLLTRCRGKGTSKPNLIIARVKPKSQGGRKTQPNHSRNTWACELSEASEHLRITINIRSLSDRNGMPSKKNTIHGITVWVGGALIEYTTREHKKKRLAGATSTKISRHTHKTKREKGDKIKIPGFTERRTNSPEAGKESKVLNGQPTK